jgi:hypothetical protein
MKMEIEDSLVLVEPEVSDAELYSPFLLLSFCCGSVVLTLPLYSVLWLCQLLNE